MVIIIIIICMITSFAAMGLCFFWPCVGDVLTYVVVVCQAHQPWTDRPQLAGMTVCLCHALSWATENIGIPF